MPPLGTGTSPLANAAESRTLHAIAAAYAIQVRPGSRSNHDARAFAQLGAYGRKGVGDASISGVAAVELTSTSKECAEVALNEEQRNRQEQR